MEWYAQKNSTLPEKFLIKFNSIKKLLTENPFIFAVIEFKIRRASIYKFPYVVYYKINKIEKEVVIIAILHTRRHPKVYTKRK